MAKYNIKPIGYEKNKSVTIITTKDNKYVLKKENKSLKDLFSYLSSRSFNYYPEIIYEDGEDILYEYVEGTSSKDELIKLVSLLHLKTTTYKNASIDDYKKIYEEVNNQIDKTYYFYNNLNDFIDNQIYMAPSFYLLARNINIIYSALEYAKEQSFTWYENIKDNKVYRVVQIHNNLEDSHVIGNRLISWGKSKVDTPIIDLYNYYKKVYNDPFIEDLKKYEKSYSLKDYERQLFFILISIPDTIEFERDEYINVSKVNKILKFLKQSNNLISNYNSNDE